MLVLWGPGLKDRFARPEMQGKTRVVSGFHAEDWLRRMAGAADRFHVAGTDQYSPSGSSA
jgi:hypothetical protein